MFISRPLREWCSRRGIYMSIIRPLLPEDIPEVVAVHQRAFSRREKPPSPEKEAYFREVFFHNPWYDESLPSLVCEDSGRIVGFLGVVPRRMSLNGQAIQVAIATCFSVEPHTQNSRAAIQLMNEILADYAPVWYGGKEYYPLPKLELDELRFVLIRGLDSGDREIGIFNQHGLDVIQPYGLVLDQYLQLSRSFLGNEGSKQALVRAIAGDILPPFIFDRVKVRAQIGNSKEPTGILPVLVEGGCDSKWLRSAFCELFKIKEEKFLQRFIRVGRYRFISEFPNVGVCQP